MNVEYSWHDVIWAMECADIFVVPLWGKGILHCTELENLTQLHAGEYSQNFNSFLIAGKQYARTIPSVRVLDLSHILDKWYVFVRLDRFVPETSNHLFLGRQSISLEYFDQQSPISHHRAIVQRVFTQNNASDYPDDWSGEALVWDRMLSPLQIHAVEWHLDISYVL